MQEAKDLGNADYFPNYGDMLRNAFGKLTEADGLVYDDADHAGILIGLVSLHLAKMEDDEDNDEESTKEKITRVWWPFGNHGREAQVLESDVQRSGNYWKAGG
jgi:hypothetical protein